jgi:hypothetical protein
MTEAIWTGGGCDWGCDVYRLRSTRQQFGNVDAAFSVRGVGGYTDQHDRDRGEAFEEARSPPYSVTPYRSTLDGDVPLWRPLRGPLHIDRAALAVTRRLDLERKQFANVWSAILSRECRDVYEDRITAARGRDKAKPSVVVPLFEFAVESHVTVGDTVVEDRRTRKL